MYDVLIIGAGPAGMTAVIYAARAGLNYVIVEKMFAGGQAATTFEVDNYPGFVGIISGPELAFKFESHTEKFGAKIEYAEIDKLELDGTVKRAYAEDKVYEAKNVILAMGATPRTLGLPREEELRGSGVAYCATCDGAFYKGKTVAVAGGGNTAVEDALFLSRFCEKIYLIHRRDKLSADKILTARLMANPKVEFVWNSVITGIEGKKVERITIENKISGASSALEVNGLFIAIGTVPSNGIVPDIIAANAEGYIITDEKMRTNIEGVYAAGDIREKPLRQIVTAAADGAVAASMIARELHS